MADRYAWHHCVKGWKCAWPVLRRGCSVTVCRREAPLPPTPSSTFRKVRMSCQLLDRGGRDPAPEQLCQELYPRRAVHACRYCGEAVRLRCRRGCHGEAVVWVLPAPTTPFIPFQRAAAILAPRPPAPRARRRATARAASTRVASEQALVHYVLSAQKNVPCNRDGVIVGWPKS